LAGPAARTVRNHCKILLPSRILAGKKATLGRRPGKKDRQGFVITKLKQRQLAQKSMMDCPKLNEWDSSAVAARAYGLDGLAVSGHEWVS